MMARHAVSKAILLRTNFKQMETGSTWLHKPMFLKLMARFKRWNVPLEVVIFQYFQMLCDCDYPLFKWKKKDY